MFSGWNTELDSLKLFKSIALEASVKSQVSGDGVSRPVTIFLFRQPVTVRAYVGSALVSPASSFVD